MEALVLAVVIYFILKDAGAKKNSDAIKKAEELRVLADEGIYEIEKLLENMDGMIRRILDKALAEKGIKMSEEKYQELLEKIKDEAMAKFQRAKKTLEKAKIELELIL